MVLIKICGITCPEIALQTAQFGANYIGIVQVPSSKRYVEKVRALEVAQAIKEGGSIPVGIFTTTSPDDIYEACAAMQIHTVQLYHPVLLEPNFVCLYANCNPTFARFQQDFLLFDSQQPGSGNTLDWQTLNPPNFPWFLAGGLSCDNIEHAMAKLQPTGVDASSSLEKNGQKDVGLIKKFIEKVRHYE